MYVSNRGVSKYIPHFYKGISRGFYALKNKVLHFLCQKSTCLQPQNKKHPHFLCRFIKASMREKIYLLTFSADLKALCTPKTFFWIPPHLYNGRKSRIWANMHSTFCTLVTSEQKAPHLYKGIQRHFDHQNFSPFTNRLQTEKNTSHFLCRFGSTLSEYFFAFLLLLQQKKKSPTIFKGLQKHFNHPNFSPFTICLHSPPHTIERRQSWKPIILANFVGSDYCFPLNYSYFRGIISGIINYSKLGFATKFY